jgi:aminomethyltransferase
MDVKKTNLYDQHKVLGAKMVPFGGWKMPVSYSSVLKEHEAVRTKCGIFDVSHMGEIFITGENAGSFLQSITINDVTKLRPGKGQYTAILNEKGGMIDDLITYQISENEYLICANASNLEKDFNWISGLAEKADGANATNKSDDYSQIAIQGPNSQKAVELILDDAAKGAFIDLDYTGIMNVKLFGENAFLARTGYTGEWGYEIYLPNSAVTPLWKALLSTAEKTGIVPVGLGARDTLRLEACYVLYGNEMDESVTPLEAGIAWATKLETSDFIGKEALLALKQQGVKRGVRAFVLEDNAIPRQGMDIYKGDQLVGKVTSGSVLPTVGGKGGMALIQTDFVKVGDSVEIDVRGKRKLAKIVKKPLYTAKTKG